MPLPALGRSVSRRSGSTQPGQDVGINIRRERLGRIRHHAMAQDKGNMLKRRRRHQNCTVKKRALGLLKTIFHYLGPIHILLRKADLGGFTGFPMGMAFWLDKDPSQPPSDLLLGLPRSRNLGSSVSSSPRPAFRRDRGSRGPSTRNCAE